MYWRERRLLCTLCLLLGVLTGGRSEPQYVLSSPAALLSGENGKVCVNIVGNKEKLDVSVIMQHDGKNTTIIGEDVSSPTYFQCADYKIPDASAAVPVTLMLSAKGQETEILERKTVVIKPNKNNCIFQMDKPIYKPGQKVLSRVVCLNSQLKPVNEKFTTIYLQDPSRTRIKQWRNQETQHGVLSLDFQLIKDAPLGSYSYIAERESSYSMSNYFTVEEYLPPRFSVTVDVPSSVSALQEIIKFKVSAMYTYGEPVAGEVIVRSCKQSSFYGRRQNCFKEKGDLCSVITGELDSDGTFKGTIDMSGRFMGLTGMSIQMDFTVIEAGTGIQVKESRYIWVTTQPAKLNFDYNAMNRYYKRGIPYPVVAKLTDEQDNPIPDEDIEIELEQNLIQTVKTDSDGKIEYGIDTTDMLAPNFTVKISYKNPDQCYYADWRDTDYPTADYTVYRFYSQSGSFLQAKSLNGELSCDQSHNIEVQYTISHDGVGEGATGIPLYYMVLSKSKIVYSGQRNIDLTNSKNGSVTIALTVSADMAPSANLVVYCILKKEMIVETVSLDIEKCFRNKVDMAFSEEKGLPGSKAEVLLSADPESICGLRVIDSSLLLLNSYEPFSPSGVHNLFSYWSSGLNVAGYNLEDPEPQCLDPNKPFFMYGCYYFPASSQSEGDSYEKLKEMGLTVGTKQQLRKLKVCDNNPPERFRPIEGLINPEGPVALKHSVNMAFADRAGSAGSAVETVRTNFSDTFMWFMVPLDKEGHASLSETVPDTITKWQGTAFCLSEGGGFGMTKYPANYTTFLPFFIELTKPYSFIRGETLVLIGVVHNYLDRCVKVEVTLGSSADFIAELKEGTQNACVCSKEKASFSWEVQAKVLGEIRFIVMAETTFIGQSCDGPNDDSQPPRKDTVVQTILVEPEGVGQELTLSNLVFVKSGMKSTLPVRIAPPNNVVPDSISAYVSAVGDVFGLPLRSLEDLVQKPYGCAEQNLARVAPIVYVLDYLNSTGQLTEEILEKGKRYMLEGYYRQLGYTSGEAYKVFRSSSEPNAWLTVYSFKTFEQAKKYIEIDEMRQQQTLIWLENLQRLDSGCFKPQGSLFTFQDTDSDLTFTAYLAIALLESKYSLGKTLLDGALECLKNASTTNQKINDEVLMLYAFTLADLKEQRDPLLEKLMKKAISKEGTIHWEREDMPARRPVPFFLPTYAPAEVQLTAYMLLSLTAQYEKLSCSGVDSTKTPRSTPPPMVSQKDVATMAQISLWLTRQQNSHGGFRSTSDTVVSLQALGAFAKMLYTPNSQQTVHVKNNNGDLANLSLDPENRLLVQRQDLPDATGDYSIEIEGNGWCLIQAIATYNIPVPKEHSAYSLTLDTTSNNCLNGVTNAFYVNVSLSYEGYRNASGMTILKIRMLSGYHPDYWSLRELVNNKVISKAEENSKGEVELYLDSVHKETIFFSFRVLMGERVLNVKQSSGLVYDYYEQDENGYASYEHPCVKHK